MQRLPALARYCAAESRGFVHQKGWGQIRTSASRSDSADSAKAGVADVLLLVPASSDPPPSPQLRLYMQFSARFEQPHQVNKTSQPSAVKMRLFMTIIGRCRCWATCPCCRRICNCRCSHRRWCSGTELTLRPHIWSLLLEQSHRAGRWRC